MIERYDARVQRLATPHDCAVFERNARDRDRGDLANQARHRWIELSAVSLAGDRAADDAVERALWAALSAREYLRGRADTRTRQQFKRFGPLKAVDRLVAGAGDAEALQALASAGLIEYAWENVVVHHAEAFSEKAVAGARERLAGQEEQAAAAG